MALVSILENYLYVILISLLGNIYYVWVRLLIVEVNVILWQTKQWYQAKINDNHYEKIKEIETGPCTWTLTTVFTSRVVQFATSNVSPQMFVFILVFRLSNKSTEKKKNTNVSSLTWVICSESSVGQRKVSICFMQGEDNLDRSCTHDLTVSVSIYYNSIYG